MEVYKDLERVLKQNKNFLIASHINPDGDAIGSLLALGEALENLDKNVVLHNRDGVPDNLKFLKNSDKIVKKIPERNFDVSILVDCATPDRAGVEFEKAKKNTILIVIDHHKIEKNDAAFSCIDESASSAGEIVYRLLKYLKTPITTEIATCIYTTIVVDTGFFKYANTSELVFKIVAELVNFGADPWKISKALEESYSLERYKLLGMALNSIELFNHGKYATMQVTLDMLEKTKAKKEDSEEFSSIPRSIKYVEVSALFREMAKNDVRISMRSNETVDVAKITKSFEGGGHKFAAGCTIKDSIENAKKMVQKEIDKVISKNTNI